MSATTQRDVAPLEFIETPLPGGGESPLFLRSAAMGQPARADVVLTHGLGEHSARYGHVAAYFAQNAFRLCTYDLRGHGRSAGRRGHIGRYTELMDDLDSVLKYYKRDGTPLFLYGHSFGAQITLNYLLERRPNVAGAILTSPWLALAFRPRRHKVLLAKLFRICWPTFTQTTFNNPAALSRDLDFLASLPGQELIHHKMSARAYCEVLAGAERVGTVSSPFGCPLLLMHGADDPITSAAATESFFKNLQEPDKTLKIYPGMRHETQNEIGRETVMAEMVEWMNHRLPRNQTD